MGEVFCFTKKLSVPSLAFADVVLLSDSDYDRLVGAGDVALKNRERGVLATVGTHVFRVCADPNVEAGTVQLGNFHRMAAQLRLDQEVPVRRFHPPRSGILASGMTVELAYVGRGDVSNLSLDAGGVGAAIKRQFSNHVYAVGQSAALQFKLDETRTIPLKFTVKSFELMSLDDEDQPAADSSRGAPAAAGGGGGGSGATGEPRGDSGAGHMGSLAQLVSTTDMTVLKAPDAPFKLAGGSSKRRTQLFGKGFNFEALGIGGLDSEFQLIFRQAFASRLLPPAVVEHMGLDHVRGMLLFGPPGCGKTLIARQIGKALHAHEPKVVNGPEILNKYVGQSEENIRELFAEASREQEERGDESDLHIIIFDEIDAICRRRGTVGGGTGVHDSIVNQLLSKIDGVDSLNNVLVIGMTNRKDMLDDALLRPGRLEVHVEIGLPDEVGRGQILNIHTTKLRKNNYLESDVDLAEVSALTKNFTGAELARVVRNARSYAISRVVDPTDLTKQIDTKNIRITQEDFVRAVQETDPAFGSREGDLKRFFDGGVVNHGEDFSQLMKTLQRLVRQLESSDRTPLMTVCLEGASGSGKSAIAAKIATESGFPFVKRIGADTLLGLSEVGKTQALADAFGDAYKSPLSLLILDDLERMLEYVPIGPRFSNNVLQTLLVLLRRPPPSPEGPRGRPMARRLMVIATTSESRALEEMGLVSAFTMVQQVPLLQSAEQFSRVMRHCAADTMDEDEIASAATELADTGRPVGTKRFLTLLEMARQSALDALPPIETSGGHEEGEGEGGEEPAKSDSEPAAGAGEPQEDRKVRITAADLLQCAVEIGL